MYVLNSVHVIVPISRWQKFSRKIELLIQLHIGLKYTMVGDMIGLTENMTMKQDIHKLVT